MNNIFRFKSFMRTPMFWFSQPLHKLIRNIGVSAHIDSGKTTFSERVLYYGGRIHEIHEVKGADSAGATMDFMELEKEKGITIQSAATHLKWKGHQVNLIDTPGHVDFTIEVERALRVLDGGVLLICGVAGVQPQTLTVHKQMSRYKVPRIIFINKLDRMGANPWSAIQSIRKRLSLTVAAVQIPIGQDQTFNGLVDLIKMKAYFFEGLKGEDVKETEIPERYLEEAKEKRQELIETLGSIDPEIEDLYLNEQPISEEKLKSSIRKNCQEHKFYPVFMGSAYKNKGVQLALDGVVDYLPAPEEKQNFGFQISQDQKEEKKIEFKTDPKLPFVGYAFKLEENKFGQLTYVRVYQGKLKKGDYVYNMKTKKRVKVARMAKMHANQMEEINDVEAGDIFAVFGVDCSSGDTLVYGDMNYQVLCSSMFVPQPVMSLSIKPTKKEYSARFQKALSKFQREDPTFNVDMDKESEEIIISGMGELHLQIYAERMRREFEIDVQLGQPTVNYRETITQKQQFDYLHKKQSGGAGQYAKVIGYMEPLQLEEGQFSNQFENHVIGTSIPNEYITAVEKGFYESVDKGPLTGYPVVNVRFVLEGGETHVVDSSSNAFMTATKYAFAQTFRQAGPEILEPVMAVEIMVPAPSYQQAMVGIAKRRGSVTNTESRGDMFVLNADVPLSQMFGYATELRGFTSGQGEFSLEYKRHDPVPPNEIETIIAKFKKQKRGQ
ncbi:unnamed protein product [Paramecium primaurelia]|uniref:Elongation factor G, mitochondrial n=1 Tax=Paramecium primaurelia TaxID=5886 RepID=A0A8S1K0Q1_PARPR|nr:unnamed protein product [Paramecium primaurelia]